MCLQLNWSWWQCKRLAITYRTWDKHMQYEAMKALIGQWVAKPSSHLQPAICSHNSFCENQDNKFWHTPRPIALQPALRFTIALGLLKSSPRSEKALFSAYCIYTLLTGSNKDKAVFVLAGWRSTLAQRVYQEGKYWQQSKATVALCCCYCFLHFCATDRRVTM